MAFRGGQSVAVRLLRRLRGGRGSTASTCRQTGFVIRRDDLAAARVNKALSVTEFSE